MAEVSAAELTLSLAVVCFSATVSDLGSMVDSQLNKSDHVVHVTSNCGNYYIEVRRSLIFSPLVLKYQIDLSTILLPFYGTISHLIYVGLFITSSLLLFQTRLCLIFQPLFSLGS